VVLLLAAADVTLLHVAVPPLSNARLKAALPNLVEEHVLGDPDDCVLVAAPVEAPDGTRTIAVVQRAWFEALVRGVLGMGARAVSALPAQLCLPLQPGSVAGAIGAFEITLRHGLHQGLGLAMASPPGVALQTVRALAGDSPLDLYVPPEQLGEYQALAAEAGPGITLAADHWSHWISGAKTTTLDLVPGLGAAGTKARDWQRWRWPLRLALLAVIVNLAGMNIEWLRMKREAAALTQGMIQTFRAAYPKDVVTGEPMAQMRQNIARAKAASGQVASNEYLFMAAALGEAVRALPRQPSIASLEYREQAMTIKLKPETTDAAMIGQLQPALAARGLELKETAPAAWQLRSTGVKQ
jgi:general secretion pathway protein L